MNVEKLKRIREINGRLMKLKPLGSFHDVLGAWIKNRADGSLSQSEDLLAVGDFIINSFADTQYLISESDTEKDYPVHKVGFVSAGDPAELSQSINNWIHRNKANVFNIDFGCDGANSLDKHYAYIHYRGQLASSDLINKLAVYDKLKNDYVSLKGQEGQTIGYVLKEQAEFIHGKIGVTESAEVIETENG